MQYNFIDKLRDTYVGSDYHIINQNCNSFSNALVKALTGKEIPGYINRLAYLASSVSCLLPDNLTNQAPVDNGNSGRGSSISSRSSSGP